MHMWYHLINSATVKIVIVLATYIYTSVLYSDTLSDLVPHLTPTRTLFGAKLSDGRDIDTSGRGNRVS